jgi:hypothetical protein
VDGDSNGGEDVVIMVAQKDCQRGRKKLRKGDFFPTLASNSPPSGLEIHLYL